MELPSGIKKTKQREEIYRILEEAEKPLTAIEIYEKIEGGRYAISTVYRVLQTFEEAKVIHKSTLLGEETAVYELDRGGHNHYAICLACHKTVPLAFCPFEHMTMQSEVDGFTITNHKIELYGYCKDCEKNQKGNTHHK